MNGAVHRPKQKRFGLTRFVPQVGVDEELGFDFVHEEEALRNVARKFEEGKKKHAHDNWVTGNQLSSDYVGGATVLDKKIQEYAAWKTAFYIQAGMLPEDAAKKVLEDFAGVYANQQGKEAWHISVSGKKEMQERGILQPRSERAPQVPNDTWQSGSQLSDEYVGGGQQINAKIREYEAWKKQDYIETGMPLEEVNEKMFKEWAGVYTEKRGIKEAWHVSANGKQEMIARGMLKLASEKAPSVPDDTWRSASQLKGKYVGHTSANDKKIQEYAAWKTAFYIQAGMLPEDAATKVFEESAGIYTNKVGGEVWHVSVPGEQEMISRDMLRRASEKAPSAPDDTWRSGDKLVKGYVGDNKGLDRKIREYAARKTETYIQAGMPPEDAATKVFEESAGIYTGKGSSREAWRISGMGIEELEAQGILVKKTPKQSTGSLSSNIEDLKSKPIPKKETKPGGKDLKRKGRSRGVANEEE